mgnify:CR=1 FL=1
MAQFSWAYVNCNETTGNGPDGAVQFTTGNVGDLSGSGTLLFQTSSNNLYLSGTLNLAAEIADPSAPADGTGGYLYSKNDGILYWRSYEGIWNLTNDTGSSGGPVDSIQFRKGTTEAFTGSAHFSYVTGSDKISGSCGVQHNRILTTAVLSASLRDYYIGVNTAGGAITIYLPSAATAGNGHTYVIKDEQGSAATNNITIEAMGAEVIDNSKTHVLQSAYASISLYCNGSNKWFIY